jgi:hypothetical protein
LYSTSSRNWRRAPAHVLPACRDPGKRTWT